MKILLAFLVLGRRFFCVLNYVKIRFSLLILAESERISVGGNAHFFRCVGCAFLWLSERSLRSGQGNDERGEE
mgnify:CR=1 FL=1